MRTINEIIVHCTATPRGRDIGAAQIGVWHKANGWNGIGYHHVVRLDGSIERGRPEEQAGAHCIGHNAHSIGVVYVGGLEADGKTPADTRTPAQKEALVQLLRRLKARYPGAVIRGHRDFAAKACPCFDATAEYRNV